MASAQGWIATSNGSKYLQQLCKHWSHKLAVEYSETEGTVRFPDAVAKLTAGGAMLSVIIESEQPETVERLKGVVLAHLDRFAFREAPLKADWNA